MYALSACTRLVAVVTLVYIGSNAARVSAQVVAPPAASEQPEQTAAATQHEHADDTPMAREGSGTAWLPDATPMYAIHRQYDAWQLMVHDNVFLQFLHESGDRDADQVGSINWVMGMTQRGVGRGRLMFRGMFSAEPWTIRGCGYPDLLASGEQCKGETIHDRQHPHDLVMELSAGYDAPLKGQVRWQVYGGPAGEPALGPVAYPHRLSAMPNPLAPIAHHWLDSTHVTFGVVTGGVYGNRWKAEASVFNGREPDDNRTNFDFGTLDSISGRLWVLPTANLALQVSAGRLKEAEAAENAGPRLDVNKVTATATYHRMREHAVWASTIGWGRNSELGRGTNALLLETSVTLSDRDAWFGRLEVVGKTPDDLAVTTVSDTQALTKLQGGYTRYLPMARGLRAGLGAEASIGFVPEALRTTYGSRANVGGGIFVTFRPARMTAGAQTSQPGDRTMVMVQTAFDPAKLSCSPTIDPKEAPKATYQGKTYYFCSVKERDDFLTNPAMSLSMMPPKQ